MNILVITLMYHPDHGPGAPLYTMLCEQLARMGHAVTVVAAVPHYPTGSVAPEYRHGVIQESNRNGVHIMRIRLPSVNRSRMALRLWHYVIYQIGAAWDGLRQACDVAIVTNPALQAALPFAAVAGLRHKPTVYCVHDVYPDAGIALGIFRNRFVISAVAGLESYCIKRATRVRILSKSFAPAMRRLGALDANLTLIYDWVDTDFIRPLPRDNAFAREHDLVDKTVVMYAGNMGQSQGLEQILAAAQILAADDGLHFAFVGEGGSRDELIARAATAQLNNVTFIPFQPRERLPEVLASADISLVCLKKNIGFQSLPSKSYSILASGRPIIACVDEGSDSQQLIERSQAGICLPPEEPQQLAEAIARLKQDDRQREQMGQNGREYAVRYHSPQSAALSFESLLQTIAGKHPIRYTH